MSEETVKTAAAKYPADLVVLLGILALVFAPTALVWFLNFLSMH